MGVLPPQLRCGGVERWAVLLLLFCHVFPAEVAA